MDDSYIINLYYELHKIPTLFLIDVKIKKYYFFNQKINQKCFKII